MLTSISNPRIQQLRDVLRAPEEHTVFAAEGVRAAEEALRAGVAVETVFYSSKLEETPRGLTLLESLQERGAESLQVAASLLDRVSAVERSQGIAALVRKPSWTPADLTRTKRPVLLLDGVRDPGNAGTILRIADAFALGGVGMSLDTVGLFNDKVVRSAMGAVFRVPAVRLPIETLVAALANEGYRIMRAEADGAVPLRTLEPGRPTAVVLGNEGHGISPATAALVKEGVRIDMPGQAESLNVAVTAGIIAHHLGA